MKQLTQKLKNGETRVTEVPVPVLGPGMILVRNYYSLISAGTEGGTVSAARKGLIGKAQDRPQQVKQVLDVIRQQGPIQAYRAVMKKLDTHSPLGYSSVGTVIGTETGETGYATGDLVACGGGGYASHAEIIAVPRNLCVKVPQIAKGMGHSEEHIKMAAYNTLGAIAMQGVRQADLRLGETCAVIGLGLLGQLTCLLLKASGVRVVGVDINPAMVEMSRMHCADLALGRSEPGIEARIQEFAGGIGCDGVIITAATDSADPINFAGAVAKKRGTVVVVGAVPTGFDREPHYYRKELQVRMSCSYGPGRYDPEYEEKGHDYPIGYVRWTEKRNMELFQQLIASGKVDASYLTTHVFKLEDAPKAYDLILDKREPYVGILIEYDREREIDTQKIQVGLSSGHPLTSDLRPPTSIGVGFIGAGSYAQGYLLPNIPKGEDVILRGVMTSSGTSSRSVAERFGFQFCTSSEADILDNKDVNTVFIATRHNTHAKYVLDSLRAGKNVFVEKPLCLTREELSEIAEVYGSGVHGPGSGGNLTSAFNLEPHTSSLIHPQSRGQGPRSEGQDSASASNLEPRTSNLLMVGFNRRFSPLASLLKSKMGNEGPMAMIYRINAGQITKDSWVQDSEIGGGRIIGEVCHFIDFLSFINGSLPKSAYGAVLPDPAGCEDTVTVSLQFENGSIGTIAYLANGSKAMFKEYVEVYRAGVTGVITDFRELTVYGTGRPFRKKLMSQDKGQRNMVQAFIDAVRKGGPFPVPLADIFAITQTTFKIVESIRSNKKVDILT